MTTADQASPSCPAAPPRRRGASTDSNHSTETRSRTQYGQQTTDTDTDGDGDGDGETEIRLEDVPVLIELPDLTRPRQVAPTGQPKTGQPKTGQPKTGQLPKTDSPLPADSPRSADSPSNADSIRIANSDRLSNSDRFDRLAEERRQSRPGTVDGHKLVSGEATHDASHQTTHQTLRDESGDESDVSVATHEPPEPPESQSHRELAEQRKQRREAVLAEGDRRSSLRIHAIGGFVVVVVAAAAFLAFQQNHEGRVPLNPVASDKPLAGDAPLIDLAAGDGLAVEEGQRIDQPAPPALSGPTTFGPRDQQTADVTNRPAPARPQVEATAEQTTTQPLRFGSESSLPTDSSTTQRVSFGQPRSADFTIQNDRPSESKLGISEDDRLGNVATLPNRQQFDRHEFGGTSADTSNRKDSSGAWQTSGSETSRYELIQGTSPVKTGGSYPVFQMPNTGRSPSYEPIAKGQPPAGSYQQQGGSYQPSANSYQQPGGSYQQPSASNFQQPAAYPRTGVNGASAPSATNPSSATQPNGWSGSYPAAGTGGASSSSTPVQGQPVYPRTNW